FSCRSAGEAGQRGGEVFCGLDRSTVRSCRDRAYRFDWAVTGGWLLGGRELHLYGGGPPGIHEMPLAVGNPLHHGMGQAEPASERATASCDARGCHAAERRAESGKEDLCFQSSAFNGNRADQEG